MTGRFEALEVVLELVASLRAPLERLRAHDRDLTDQARRAATSIALCLGEARRREGRDRLHLIRVAAGSAAEVQTALRVGEAWGYLEPATLDDARSLLDRLLAMTWRMVHPRRA